MHEPFFKMRILIKATAEMERLSLWNILFPYPFISTIMKKAKFIILFKDCSGLLITYPLNTSRSALTAY